MFLAILVIVVHSNLKISLFCSFFIVFVLSCCSSLKITFWLTNFSPKFCVMRCSSLEPLAYMQ